MNGISPWAASAATELAEDKHALFEYSSGGFNFKVYHTSDSVWVTTESPKGGKLAFRSVYCRKFLRLVEYRN